MTTGSRTAKAVDKIPGAVTVISAAEVQHTLSLTGDAAADAAAVRDAMAGLRAALADLADDPLLLLPSEVRPSRAVREGGLPPRRLSVLDAAEEAPPHQAAQAPAGRHVA